MELEKQDGSLGKNEKVESKEKTVNEKSPKKRCKKICCCYCVALFTQCFPFLLLCSVTLIDEKISIESNGNNNFDYVRSGMGDPIKSCRENLNEKQMSWVDGIFNCMKPVLSLIGKSNSFHEVRMRNIDDWEIPFEIISDIEWLGSGAQGAVFSGKLYNEIVAVKKVKDVRETDIRHLRKLNHENIVKFK